MTTSLERLEASRRQEAELRGAARRRIVRMVVAACFGGFIGASLSVYFLFGAGGRAHVGAGLIAAILSAFGAGEINEARWEAFRKRHNI